MGFMDSIFGSDSSVKQSSVLSKEQRALLKDVAGYLQGGLTQGATASQYAPYATSDLFSQALQDASSLVGFGQDTVLSALQRQASGSPAYKFDAGAVTKEWEQTFATPMMQSYQANVAPLVRESYNIPGLSDSTITARGMSDAASNFFASNVQPTLFNALQQGRGFAFQSGENAANRQLAGAQALGQAPMIAGGAALGLGQMDLTEQSRILAALRGEESRLFSENNPFLNPAASLATQQTMENIVMQGTSGMLSQALGAGLGMATMGGMSMVPGLGGLMGAGAGFMGGY